MSQKTLTIYSRGTFNGTHWDSRGSAYDRDTIDKIEDPEGGNTKEPPTSIPSPFARFDLVRTAFARLAKSEQLKGEPNDERLVSEALDVGQLFFNYDKLNDKIEIIKWDKSSGLDSLLSSPFKGHNRFGTALKLFLEQDGGTARITDDDKRSGGYNFDLMNEIYILRYADSSGSGIIGGTSPSTVFFSAPGKLSFVNVQFGKDRLFDDDFCPLHKRDLDYQKFWHGFGKQPNFVKYFPEVASYLRRSLELLQKENHSFWSEISAFNVDNYKSEFEDLRTQSDDYPEVLKGFRLKKNKSNLAQISSSEFILTSEKYSRLHADRLPPLILQDNYQGKLKYTTDKWDKSQKVETYHEKGWNGSRKDYETKTGNVRKLPGQEDYYPWLTVSDFLEPYIIRLVYPLNTNCFFDGNLTDANLMWSYLLPLKKDFFDFFDVEDLITGQKVSLQIDSRVADSVKVTLKIPLKNGEPPIVFERIYKASVGAIPLTPDESKKEGGVVMEYQFGMSLMPFVRVETINPIYRVQLIDRDLDYSTYNNNYSLKFIDSGNKILPVSPPKERSKKRQNVGDSATTKYYEIDGNFDYIQVEVAEKQGLILPRFDKVTKPQGSEKFTFAVDFGTTNTHIEYKTSKNPTARPFEVTDDDVQLVTLHDLSKTRRYFDGSAAAPIEELVSVEMLPIKIGKQEKASFPTRTALLENSPQWNERLVSFADFNPALLYEKQNLDDKIYHIATNLKWSNYNVNNKEERRVEGYIQSLLIMIRNKVLLNEGNLEATELVWFYPLSMVETRRNHFEEIWNKHYKSIITSSNYPQRIPESTAPYYWYGYGSSKYEISSAYYPAVCVDIGGGTSDVVIFEDDKPIGLTSFRFAGNAVFGDAFAPEGAANRNGFVKKYESQILTILKENGLSYLGSMDEEGSYKGAYKEIRNRQHSEDIVAFFFSLKDNRDVKKKTDKLDFGEILGKDKSLKIVFLIFYAGIIYHIAKLMKAKDKNLKMPRYLAFSGNGSKVLRILSSKPAVLSDLAKLIFEKVYGESYPEDGLTIILEQEQPKEATCKGGLKRTRELKFDTPDDAKEDAAIEKIKLVLLGTNDDRFVVRTDTYEKIDEVILSQVAAEVENFVDLVFSLNEDFNFKSRLGINTSNLEEYKKILLKDLTQNVKIGFNKKKAESDKKDPVEETLFFYPLIKGINNLAAELAK